MLSLKRIAATVLTGIIVWLGGLEPAIAQPDATRYSSGIETDQDVSVRVNGDVVQQAGEENGVIVVVRGTAHIEGRVEVLVVVDGTAELIDAEVDELTVVQGTALLGGSSRISGDVRLINATLEQEEGAEIEGEVLLDGEAKLGPGAALFGVIFGVGYMIAVVLAGVGIAVWAPRAARRIGRHISEETVKTAGAGLVLWIALPLIGAMAVVTLIGVPLAIGLFLFFLPLLAFAGYLIAGIRIGDLTMERFFGALEYERPIQATILGLTILMMVGWVPFVGALITPLAVFFGTGALALAGWRAAFHRDLVPGNETAMPA